MVLANATSDFFTHFSVGTLMALTLVQEPQLKRSFYLFTSVVCAVCIALGIYLRNWSGPGIGYLLGSLPWLVGFYVLYAFERRRMARWCLFAALIFGLIGVFGVLNDSVRTLALTPLQKILLHLNLTASLFLGGIVVCTLLLGHWYLISPRLSFVPLMRGALTFFVAVWIRLAVLVAILWAFEGVAPRLFSWSDFGMFFLLRIFWGIVGPAILAFMVYKTAQIQSNQSATGILYVALVFVLIGELITDYIWALALIPM